MQNPVAEKDNWQAGYQNKKVEIQIEIFRKERNCFNQLLHCKQGHNRKYQPPQNQGK